MKKLFISLSFLSLISQPVRAEWEFTRWGMSPEALKQAAPGEVISVSPQERSFTSDAQAKTLWKTRWTLEQFDFDVYFNFSGNPRALKEVILISRGNNQGIVDALERKYGPPTRGQGQLRMQRRTPNFTLIPSNPDNRVTPPPSAEFTGGVRWETETDIIDLNRDNPEEVVIRFIPRP